MKSKGWEKEEIMATVTLKRRQFLKLAAVSAAAGIGFTCLLPNSKKTQTVSDSRLLTGTLINLTVLTGDPSAARKALAVAYDKMSLLESELSRHQADSELSLLNRHGYIAQAGDALLDLIGHSKALSRLSSGAFDMSMLPLLELYRRYRDAHGSLPPVAEIRNTLQLVDYQAIKIDGRRITLGKKGMRLTPDGIGRGYILDKGIASLKEQGFENVSAQVGVDLVDSKDKIQGQPWKTGIQHPRHKNGKRLVTFTAGNQAVATSGDYLHPFTTDFKHHQIIDPRTGYSAPELASSTVIAPTATLADGLSTMALVLGAKRSIEMLERLPGCEGYMVTKKLEVAMTSGFPAA
jgi:thiamine biosynthesis lipoprotein